MGMEKLRNMSNEFQAAGIMVSGIMVLWYYYGIMVSGIMYLIYV